MCTKNQILNFVVSIIIVSLLIYNVTDAQIWQDMNGPWRANVTEMTIGRAAGASNPTLYAVSGSKLFRSTDGASSWEVTNPGDGNPLVVACKPSDPSYVLLGIERFLKFSLNSGSSWTNIYSNDPVLTPLSVSISAPNSNYMFMGMKKVNGQPSMRRTSNGGSNWILVDYFFSAVMTDVKAVTPHPQFQVLVWAGGSTPVGYNKTGETYSTSFTNGVFFSTNAGANWSNTGNLAKNVVALAAYTRNTTDNLFAATDDPVNKLYRTTSTISETAVWTVVSFPGGLISDLKVDQNNNLYAASTDGIYKSTNDGSTWTTVCNGLYDNTNFKKIGVDPGNINNVFAGSSTTIYRSTNAGVSWVDVATNILKMSTSAVAVSGNNNLALSSNFSVIKRNIGSGWLNVGPVCVTNFRGRMVRFKNPSATVAFAAGFRAVTSGTNASLWRSTNFGNSPWSEIRSNTFASGKFNGILVDPVNTERIYVYGRWGLNNNISVSNNGGDSWGTFTIPGEVSDLVIDATNAQPQFSITMYAAVNIGESTELGIWKTTNAGGNWVRLDHPLVQGQPVRVLGLRPSHPSVIYAAGGASGTWWMRKSTDGGINWTTMQGIGMASEITRILMHPDHPTSTDHLIIIGDNGNNLYYTSNGGTNWNNVTGNIPTPIHDITTDPSNPKVLFAATNQGIFRIGTIPPPQLSLPLNNSTNIYYSTTLQWQSVSGAVSYSIQVADNPGFINPINYTNKVGNKFTIKDLGYNKTYYWRVNSSNGISSGDWSSAWLFQTVISPPTPIDVLYNIIGGWNMLGVPNLLSNYSPAVVWPAPPRSSDIYLYDGGYKIVYQIENGPGYFVKFSEALGKIYTGNPVTLLPISVKKGWNIVGSSSAVVPTSAVTSEPPGIIESNFFAYQNGYITTYNIVPGGGYWVKVRENGQLILNSAASKNVITSSHSTSLDKFRITDSEGNSQELFVANTQVSPEFANTEVMMPPALPFVNFDARFESGEYIKNVDPDVGIVELNIRVNAENYPLTINWDINPENALTYSVSFIPEGSLGKPQIYKVGTSGNLLLPKIKDGIISLKTGKDESLEKSLTYSLNENYPNPFNPNTIISYTIAEPNNVKLVVHDILGREVKILVNEYQSAGLKTVNFDAGDLPSGVYFYKLTAGSFTSVKKMLLLR